MFGTGTRTRLVAIAVTLVLAAPSYAIQVGDGDPITLELIMGDSDWIGNSPENPYWADDSKSFYYFQKRVGQERRDLVQMDLV